MILYSLVFHCNHVGCPEHLIAASAKQEVEEAYVVLYQSGWSASFGKRKSYINHYCPEHRDDGKVAS